MLKRLWVFSLFFVQLGFISVGFSIEQVVVPIGPFAIPFFIVESDTEVEGCSQFTGNWYGFCDGVDGKKELHLRLEQAGCSTLSIDGVVHHINGMDVSTNHNDSQMSTMSSSLSWDTDKIKIIGHSEAMGKLIGKRRTLKFQHKTKFTFEKEKANLLLTSETQTDTFTNEIKQVTKTDNTCRLEKKIEPKSKQAE